MKRNLIVVYMHENKMHQVFMTNKEYEMFTSSLELILGNKIKVLNESICNCEFTQINKKETNND